MAYELEHQVANRFLVEVDDPDLDAGDIRDALDASPLEGLLRVAEVHPIITDHVVAQVNEMIDHDL